MWQLGYPRDAIAVVRSIYCEATTTIRSTAGQTPPIPIARGVIQGDGVSPLLFSIAIEPLLRLLESDCSLAAAVDHRRYKGYAPYSVAEYRDMVQDAPRHHSFLAALAYADDICLLAGSRADMQRLLDRVQAFSDWSGMQLAPQKCEASAILYGSQPRHATDPDTVARETAALRLGTQPLRLAPPAQATKYLGIWISLDLNWAHHAEHTIQKLQGKADAIYKSRLSDRQKLEMEASCILHSARHSFCVAPFTLAHLRKIDSLRARLYKYCMGMPASSPHAAVYAPPEHMGLGAESGIPEYTQVCAEAQATSLSHPGRLGTLSRAFMHALLADPVVSQHLAVNRARTTKGA